MGVVGDLEDEAAERLVGAGLAGDLGPFLGVVADDGRLVERAGQVGGDGVEQALDADVLEARAAEDRLRLAGERGAAEARRRSSASASSRPVEVGHVVLRRRLRRSRRGR